VAEEFGFKTEYVSAEVAQAIDIITCKEKISNSRKSAGPV